ncbi:MAG: DUF4476 domain-containing protein [Bacteroidetes bacterium]|nr:DUF4476 domain-containing protein [Bacteroidota bacterium]MBS1649231.1 DUF4476 domain-containing protein [Bacteroidota bacterium]
MKYFILFFINSLLLFKLNAQEKHFMFIQSSNGQPFYVQLNNNIYSSTASGYVNIAQLLQGKYYLTVGFAKDIFPEQKFVVDVADGQAGIGFTLKQLDSKTFVLVNYITDAIIKTDSQPEEKKELVVKKTEEPKPQEVAIINKEEIIQEEKINTQINSPIIKMYDKKSSLGIDQVYIDTGEKNKSDTIAIFIPATNTTIVHNTVKTINTVNTTENAKPVKCNNNATAEDFYKLRLDMAAATTDVAMIDAANKFFSKKCFTTEQIKNLGVLFLTDSGKYTFFETAKPHVSDVENFNKLSSQFTSTQFIEKFNLLIK